MKSKIQIKTFGGSVLFEYETEENSVKNTMVEAVKKGANLWGANLWGANLGGANLNGANLNGANLWGADLWNADLKNANLKNANLGGANLGGANLGDANLNGANLYGANLYGANLLGAKEYVNSHDFFIKCVKRKNADFFSEKEWSIIGQIVVPRICWNEIRKRFGKKVLPIFNKLSKDGFDEWEKHYTKFLKESKNG